MTYLIHKAGRHIVDKTDAKHHTPLYYAARSGCSPDVLRLLLRNGASILGAQHNRLHRMKKRQRLSAYCCYLRDDLPTQVSIAVKTALIMPFRATATASLPAEVFDYIQAFIGVPTPPTVSLPISQQLPFGRCINQMVNSYLSSAYQSIRETGTMEACGLGDLLDQVRQKAMEEGRRLGINVMSADKVKSHGWALRFCAHVPASD
mmetsp:Transcript_35671/g.88763  ORF Transcript_35671/g.88763 Transcript_35671/m.88763 type:complete len:205 (-) Transcript_35671:248-862(-)